LRAKEFITEVPTSGTTGTTGTINTAVGTGTPKPKPGVDYTRNRVKGGRGSITSRSTSDDGIRTTSSQVTGQTKTSGSFGTNTTNRQGQLIQKKTPRFAGLQQTTNIDPTTGKQTTSTNYRGRVGADGQRINVTTPGTIDQFDLKKATQTQVSSGKDDAFTITQNKGGPRTMQYKMGSNTVNQSSNNPNQTTITRRVQGQPKQQATIPTSQFFSGKFPAEKLGKK